MKERKGKSTGIYSTVKVEFDSMAEVQEAFRGYDLHEILDVEQSNAKAVLDHFKGRRHPMADDARELLRTIEGLHRVLEQEKVIAEKFRAFGAWCFQLGRAAERMRVRRAESLAMEGRRVEKRRSTGGKNRAALRRQEFKETSAKIKKRFEELRKQDPLRKPGAILRQIGGELRLKRTALYEHTKEIRKSFPSR